MRFLQLLVIAAFAVGIVGCSGGEAEEVKTAPAPSAKKDEKANDMAPKLEINPDYAPPKK